MLTALKAGYATMSTDNGHVTNPDAPNGGNEQGWALGHPEKMIDFAYRALHVSTIAAKEIVQDFYGKKASESYFVGCSQGGHHALMEATRFPDDYDGIVAGAPAWHWANQMINATWNSRAALLDPSRLDGRKRRPAQPPRDRGLRRTGRRQGWRDRGSPPMPFRSRLAGLQGRRRGRRMPDAGAGGRRQRDL